MSKSKLTQDQILSIAKLKGYCRIAKTDEHGCGQALELIKMGALSEGKLSKGQRVFYPANRSHFKPAPTGVKQKRKRW